MRLLLNKHLINISDNLIPYGYYVVDENLKWVSLKSDGSYKLFSVLNDRLDSLINDLKSIGEFDTYAFKQCTPILLMSCGYEEDTELGVSFRVVNITTQENHNILTKPKEPKNVRIINHQTNKTKKLF